jgi:hypothetical protein
MDNLDPRDLMSLDPSSVPYVCHGHVPWRVVETIGIDNHVAVAAICILTILLIASQMKIFQK